MKISKWNKGFTLIELLIVIAVLGVLATVVLVSVNPAEQLARGRDAGRKTTVGQLSKAAQAYYVSQQTYPTANATWITTLQNGGEVKTIPAAVTYSISGSSACTTNAQSGLCYLTFSTSTEAVVFTRLESGSEKVKCASGNPYFLWSSTDAKAGTVCSAAEPSIQIGYTYL